MALREKPGAFVGGNWKMYKTLPEARELAGAIVRGVASETPRKPGGGHQKARFPRVGLFPNAVALAAVAEIARGSEVVVGAQNVHSEKEGAFTGEISADMVLAAGAGAVILGHSERRHVFGESDELIGRKVVRALEAGLLTVICAGETLAERDAGKTNAVVLRQLSTALQGVSDPEKLARLIFAYEPVWAIGTGRTAAPAQADEVHRFLRERLAAALRARGAAPERAEAATIIYGGSVKPENAAELFSEPNIDGFLVGGAGLKADSFLKICRVCAQDVGTATTAV